MAISSLEAVLTLELGSFNTNMREAQSSIREASESLGDIGDTADQTNSPISGLKNTLKSFAAVAAGAFAVDKIKDFAVGAVEAAAEAQAVTAQFEQVFGDSQDAATKAIEGMAEEFGMIPSRLTAPFTQTTSMFKGLGMSMEDAMGTATKATTLAADAAAFYDKSFEEADGSLKSFIKGNYEGGESIGLFANDTQMAAYAIKNNLIEATDEQQKHAEKSALAVEKAQVAYSKAAAKYGESSLEARSAQEKLNKAMEDAEAGPNLANKWSQLEEAQKQVIRVNFAEEMYAQSGAAGQAARESEGYENVMGNLKKAWTDFQAVIGAPILQVALAGMQALTGAVQSATEWVKNLDLDFSGLIDAVKGIGSIIMGTIVPAFSNFIGMISKNKIAMGLLKTVIVGAVGAFTALKIAGVVGTIIAGFTKAVGLAKTALLLLRTQGIAGVVTALSAFVNPITIVIAAVGALVAAFLYFWNTNEDFRAAVGIIWEAIQAIFKVAIDFIVALFKGAVGLIWSSLQILWNYFKIAFGLIVGTVSAAINLVLYIIEGVLTLVIGIVTSVLTTVLEVASSIWNTIVSVCSTIWNTWVTIISSVLSAIYAAVSGAFNNVKIVVETVWNVIKIILETVTGVIRGIITAFLAIVRGDWQGAWNAIKGIFETVWNGMNSVVTTIASGIKGVISNTWNSIKSITSSVWEGIKAAMLAPIKAGKSVIEGIVNTIKSLFNFKLKFPKIEIPKIPLPHFRISGSFNPLKGQIPSIGIDWYATGGIFTGASVIGVGEKGDEAVLPLSNKGRMKPFAQAVAGFMDKEGGTEETGGSGEVTITGNTFVIRQESDIKKIGEELVRESIRKRRAVGRENN